MGGQYLPMEERLQSEVWFVRLVLEIFTEFSDEVEEESVNDRVAA